MNYIIQSRIIGDTKWNFRAEISTKQKAIDFYKNLYNTIKNITRQDTRLKIHNKYRVIPN
jgi:hypothetical protein